MSVYISKKKANKIFTVCATLVVTGGVLSLATLFSVYGKASECIDQGSQCSLTVEQIAAKVGLVLVYVGVFGALVGAVLYTISSRKKER